MKLERAELGIDGDHAFALLGQNIQDGEAEFVKVEVPGDIASERRAATKALNNLRQRLGKPALSYFLGESHPSFC